MTQPVSIRGTLWDRSRALLCLAALLAGGWNTSLSAADDGEFREAPKPKESKPKDNKLKKSKDGWTDPNYTAIDSLGKVDSGQRSRSEMGADANLSPDELHAKYLKHLRDQQEKMTKLQEDLIKKETKRKEQQAKDSRENKSIVGDIVPGKNQRVLEVNKDTFKDMRQPRIVEPPKETSTNRAVNFKTADGKTPPSITTDKPGEGVDIIKPGGTYKLPVKTAEPKRGFFDKLLGRKKESNEIQVDDGDGQMQLSSGEKARKALGDPDRFVPHDSEYRSTATQRLRDVMQRKREEDSSSEKSEKAEKSDKNSKKERAEDRVADTGEAARTDARTEIVPLDEGLNAKAAPVTPAPDAGAEVVSLIDHEPVNKPLVKTPTRIPQPDISAAEAVDTAALPETDYDVKAEADRAYQAGLRSKDIVAREAAYQRAGWERRADAIPFLMEEVKLGAALRVPAADVLGVMPRGEHTEAIELLLMRELIGHDPLLRKSCADALGRMRSRRAVTALIERIRPDKNPKARFPYMEPSLPARSACVESLGSIGEREAIEPLKAKLEEDGEVEFVKSRAALSLARLGDPSGRAHLIKNLDSSSPAMQVMGLNGLAQLSDPGVVVYLGSALESRHEEVWTTAIFLFPRMGPAVAMPLLRQRLDNGNEITRRRVALAMGFLGSDDGIMYIDRAVRFGTIAERVMGCELLANLARTDCVPLLIEKLQDPSSNVRMNAAVALTRLNAVDAIGPITESSRTIANQRDLPPWMRNNGPDVYERLVMLSCVRILRGEKEDLVITSLPDMRDNVWPEVDRVMGDQQTELLKLYQFVDVIASGTQALGVVLRAPNGQEMTYRSGEPVAGGFKVRDIGMPVGQAGATKNLTGYVTLVRGDDRVTLAQGRPATVDNLRKKDNK